MKEVIMKAASYSSDYPKAPIYVADLVRCAECRWSRPRVLIGETGYRCVFYRVDKAESGYCDCGEREGE